MRAEPFRAPLFLRDKGGFGKQQAGLEHLGRIAFVKLQRQLGFAWAVLVNKRFRPSHAAGNFLDEPGDLGHDVYPVEALFEAAFDHGLDFGAILGGTGPCVFDLCRLGPVIFGILLGGNMRGCRVGAGAHNLAVARNAANGNDSRAVRGGRDKLHEHGRVLGPLEVGKVPARGQVVGLHALQGVNEKSAAAGKVNGAVLFCGDCARGDTARPKDVAHGAPGVVEVCAEQGLARGPGLEAWRRAFDDQIDDSAVVVVGLDGVGLAVLGQLDGAVCRVERGHVLAKLVVLEGRGAPESLLLGVVDKKDLGVELASGTNATEAC